ncbi:hypothetical protein [Streptomyces zaomyceticus]|uniref:hypothetical protein n=1 Tax=Streptomyces zaomyceticus TaxID=68286 RepID=UPI002E0D1991|nr:hypothetical protein OG237_18305 [Streptomyces zaomyceticus]
MTEIKLEKARAAAVKAAEELAKLESQEAEKAAQIAAEKDAKQRELDVAFLAQWQTLDAELMDAATGDAAAAVYSGVDPIQAVAAYWIARQKRNVVRQYAQNAYLRVHRELPPNFAADLGYRDMMIAQRIEEAISNASRMHAADFSETLDEKWMVPDAG